MKVLIKQVKNSVNSKDEKSEELLENLEEIRSLLGAYGVLIEKIPTDADNNFLESYEDFVEKFKAENNYISSDTVELDSSTPETTLDPFKEPHHHEDDEIRFTISGEGIFGLIDEDSGKEIEIYCEKGDFIKIPANTRHWFKLCDSKQMKCVRIFKDNPKWEAIY